VVIVNSTSLGLFLHFQTAKPRQFAIYVLLRIVAEYSLRREISIPVTRGPGLGHPKLAGASFYRMVSLSFLYM
jgi:hypothetical protein